MPSALRAYTARGGSSGRDSVITRNQLVDERPGPLFWPRAATVILMNKLSFGTTSPTRRSAGARLSCGTAGPGSTGHYCRAVCPVPRACRQPARQRASEPSGIRPPGPRLAVDGGPVLRGALPSGCSACMLAVRRSPPRDSLEIISRRMRGRPRDPPSPIVCECLRRRGEAGCMRVSFDWTDTAVQQDQARPVAHPQGALGRWLRRPGPRLSDYAG